ncbi:MAG: aspartate aminotransferase family protein [Elusimicrobia bacterium]|nr:aspartate aminotransferase family protein [Elusimicrobiota bacterium]
MTDWTKEEDAWLLPGYAKFPFVPARAEGAWVIASDGRRYLDFYGGHAVALLGHCPPPVVKAVQEQAETLLFYSTLAYSPIRAKAARTLARLCGEPGSKVFFCNSGAEANENAMRIARLATGKKKIVATQGSFHGRTAGALAATGLAKYRKGLAGLGTDVAFVGFGDAAAAEAALARDAAGLLLEPIQSMSGALCPPAGYLQALEAACAKHGAALIFDEVQTGLGRVGAPSAAQAYGVRPGLQTFAKGLGSGVPCGAVLASPALAAKVKPGDLGSTFGGGPLACAAIEATLAEVASKKLWENAAALERLIRATFAFPGLVGIQGRGLLLGLVLDRPAKGVQQALLDAGILVGTSDAPNVLRLLPPLTIGATEVGLLKAALESCLAGQGAPRTGGSPGLAARGAA